ncbi:MAG: hypothetical protein AUI14_05535 [Actinobacteria bacterium 13_2_20CM_2_71_6]|nr:MAG: hypothetical protein AUI14_05535 [Actinobacteria bacterium 13_2_20CM_2_71_6]
MPATATIIGLGPRGLGLLERFAALAGDDADAIEVHVVDPTCAGAGVHVTDQPDYLLMHCPGSDLTMFPDSASLDGEPERAGFTFFEWARDTGVLVEERAVAPTDFLPRSLFGRYLQWFRERVEAAARGRVRIVFHRDVAVDARDEPGGRIVVVCGSGAEISSDFLCVAVGYGQVSTQALPFPLPAGLDDIPAGARIGLSGFGLTSLDIVSHLTVGRGGTFRTAGAGLEYVPSGSEPEIVVFSRSGVPARARPYRVGVRQEHEPAVLTEKTARRLADRGTAALDFEADILPLIETEMRVAYWRTYDGGRFREAVDAGDMDALEDRYGRLDTRALLSGADGMRLDDQRAYESWACDYIAADLAEAARYPDGSAVKAALEAIEDAFDTIRGIIRRQGLTPGSQATFLDVHGPRLRRIAVGPIAERQAEFLALLRGGVVRAPLGPDPVVDRDGERVRLRSRHLSEPYEVEVSTLLNGHIALILLDDTAPELIANLHARGILRPYAAAGTVDVDERLHPRGADGRSHPRIWLLGPICEGTSFYTHVLPEPGNRSDCVIDAHRVVTELLTAARAAGPV